MEPTSSTALLLAFARTDDRSGLPPREQSRKSCTIVDPKPETAPDKTPVLTVGHRASLESRLVRHLMPDASPAEIADATRRWFSFLETLADIVDERERRRASNSEDGEAPHRR